MENTNIDKEIEGQLGGWISDPITIEEILDKEKNNKKEDENIYSVLNARDNKVFFLSDNGIETEVSIEYLKQKIISQQEEISALKFKLEKANLETSQPLKDKNDKEWALNIAEAQIKSLQQERDSLSKKVFVADMKLQHYKNFNDTVLELLSNTIYDNAKNIILDTKEKITV